MATPIHRGKEELPSNKVSQRWTSLWIGKASVKIKNECFHNNSCVKIIQRNFSTVSKLYFQLSIPVHVLTIHEHTYDYPDFYNYYLLLSMIHTCKHGQKPRNSIQLKIRIEYYHNKKFTWRYRILFMIQTFINTTYMK